MSYGFTPREAAAYDAWKTTDPDMDREEFDGYCDICGMDNDEHTEDCYNWGTTEEERAIEAAEANAEAAGEAAYEAAKERYREDY